ncbi:MAG: metal-dependent hydrolase [Bryobacteraceae bacterium]
MDNLTHTFVGLMLSRAGLNRVSPYATPLLLLASNVPDIDIVTLWGGSLAYLDHHRGFTHGIFAIPIMGLLPALAVGLWKRRETAWRTYLPRALALCSIGVAVHLVLDWTNTYGIRLLSPFVHHWFRLDITNVIDIWIWALLLVGVAAPALARLVHSEIGGKRPSGRLTATLVLAAILVYSFGRWLSHDRALAMLNARLYRGQTPRRVAALPGPVNPFRWTGLVEGDGFWIVVPVDVLGGFDPAAGRVLFHPDHSAAIDAARRTGTFQRYLNFSLFPHWRVTPVAEPEGGLLVEAMDLRFGIPPRDRFIASALLDSSLRVIRSEYRFGPLRPSPE